MIIGIQSSFLQKLLFPQINFMLFAEQILRILIKQSRRTAKIKVYGQKFIDLIGSNFREVFSVTDLFIQI